LQLRKVSCSTLERQLKLFVFKSESDFEEVDARDSRTNSRNSIEWLPHLNGQNRENMKFATKGNSAVIRFNNISR
jgi:hypothetical protein